MPLIRIKNSSQKYYSPQDLIDERIKYNRARINFYKPANEMAKVIDLEDQAAEFPDAVIIDQNVIRNKNEFYANDMTQRQETSQGNNIDVKFSSLFKDFGQPAYVFEIIKKLNEQLSESEKNYLVENENMLKKQIRENLSKNTSINFFVEFVAQLASNAKDKFTKKHRVNILMAGIRKALNDAYADGHVISFDQSSKIKIIVKDGVKNTNVYKYDNKSNSDFVNTKKEFLLLEKDNGDKMLSDLVDEINKQDRRAMQAAQQKLIDDKAAEVALKAAKAQKKIDDEAAKKQAKIDDAGNTITKALKNTMVKKKKKKDDADKAAQQLIDNAKAPTGKGLKKNKTKLIRGKGMIIEEEIKIKKKAPKNLYGDNDFYELNKFSINKKKLNENMCEMRYTLNSKKFRTFNIPNKEIKNIIVGLGKNKEFSIVEYEKLNEDNKNFILKFCDTLHVNIGFSNCVKELEKQKDIYEGELNAGNPAPMLNFLLNAVFNGTLSKEDYLLAVKDMIN